MSKDSISDCRVREINLLGKKTSIIEPRLKGRITDADDARRYIGLLEDILAYCLGPVNTNVSIRGSETIGQRYTVYKYSVTGHGEVVGECRIISDNRREDTIIHAVCVIDTNKIAANTTSGVREHKYEPVLRDDAPRGIRDGLPGGQKLIPKPVVYAVNGMPEIDIGSWRLVVEGLVENRLELSYNELLSLGLRALESMFHCVTGWSLDKMKWEGVPLEKIAKLARVREDARWVLIEGLDGYTTVVPLEDFLSPYSMLVLKLNGEPLSLEHGFPARIFIPHLYGWKHAKWVKRLVFLEEYVDGYWEALGYHERGNVWLEERFKGV